VPTSPECRYVVWCWRGPERVGRDDYPSGGQSTHTPHVVNEESLKESVRNMINIVNHYHIRICKLTHQLV
jgi:hypothetical protein